MGVAIYFTALQIFLFAFIAGVGFLLHRNALELIRTEVRGLHRELDQLRTQLQESKIKSDRVVQAIAQQKADDSSPANSLENNP